MRKYQVRFGGGPTEKCRAIGNSPAAYPTDEGLRHTLTKRVGGVDPEAITEVLTNADRLLAAIPSGQRDFDRAKADVMARTSL
jgi:hypothetical protein